MSAFTEILLIAYVVSVACVFPGIFLVLRKMAMLSDAITHTVLLGIVVGYFMVNDLNSPILLIGAALVGLLTALFVEMLHKTKRVTEDVAIGIVFPLLFSIAILLISRYASNTHLCTDSVLLGEIAFAPFDRFVVGGMDLGPKTLWTMGSILVIDLGLTVMFFKELKLATFDNALAAHLGFLPVLVHYGIMTMVSVTTVGAFQAVGSILVIAFLIGPPITAYLLTHDLRRMIVLSVFFALLDSSIGFFISTRYDFSIAGTIATVIGIVFFITLFFAPNTGLISLFLRRKKQRTLFNMVSLLYHVSNHSGEPNEAEENGVDTIRYHLGWKTDKMKQYVQRAESSGYLNNRQGILRITNTGMSFLTDKSKALFE